MFSGSNPEMLKKNLVMTKVEISSTYILQHYGSCVCTFPLPSALILADRKPECILCAGNYCAYAVLCDWKGKGCKRCLTLEEILK